jgi:predicted nucleic acid-binding protein
LGYLIDTSVWVDVERGALGPADVAAITANEPVYLSPTTIAELRFGGDSSPAPGIRQKRLAALDRLRRKPCLRIDAGTGEVFGRLAADLKARGRGHAHRIQDLWLASQAIQHGLRFLTLDRRGFEDIPGLDLVLLPRRPR